MKTYIECTLKKDPSIIMNVEKAKNIEYLNKDLWAIKEKTVKELPHLHVSGNVQVSDHAYICDNAIVYGNARVFGNGVVYENAQVSDHAVVSGNGIVSGNARVSGKVQVSGYAFVSGNAKVFGDAKVFELGEVFGNARIFGNAKVCGNGIVYGYSELCGDAIATTKTYNIFGFLGWNVTLTDNHIQIGCKQWEYEKFLRLNEIHIGLEYSQEEYSEMIPAKDILIDAIKLKRPDLFKKEEE